jgi:hypothetical protein
MDNTEYILGLGFVMQLYGLDMSREDIEKRVSKLTRGFVLKSSVDNFMSGARDGLKLVDELQTLRAAAIAHAREAEKESEKAEQVVESIEDKQLSLPIEDDSEDVPDSGENEPETESD